MKSFGFFLLAAATLFANSTGPQSIPSGYVLSGYAGTSSVGDGGPGTLALLSQPEGLAVDARGNVYIADADDHRVRRVTPDGRIATIAGNGAPGWRGDGGPAEAAQLRNPYGLAVDRAGSLYIADLGNARVRRIAADGTITTVAGGGSIEAGQGVDGSLATAVKLNTPRNVALDADGNLYFSDFSANRVYRVSTSGVITTVAGTGQAGSAGDGGSASRAQLSSPAGLAFDSAAGLYVYETGARRVRRISRDTIFTAKVISSGFPTGLAADGSGNLYLGDRGGGQIIRIASGSGALAYLPIPGSEFAIDTAGNVYASHGSQVRRMSPGGTVSIIAGTGNFAFAGDGGPAAQARLNRPTALARDIAGRVYVADSGNQRIRRIDLSGNIRTIAGTGDPALLDSPGGIAVDDAGTVWISDSRANRVRRLNADGTLTTLPVTLENPGGLVLDTTRNLYVAEAGRRRIRKIGPNGTFETAFEYEAGGLAMDRQGKLHFTDADGGHVFRLNTDGALERLTALPLRSPRGLAVLDDGGLVVVEEGANRIVRIGADRRMWRLTEPDVLDTPTGLIALADGTILVADTGNNLIRKLTPGGPAPAVVAPPVDILHAAHPGLKQLAPGQIMSIMGAGLGPADGISGGGETELAGTRVLVNGMPAALLYAGERQINAVLPASALPGVPVEVEVIRNEITAGYAKIQLSESAPAFFTLGGKQAACLNEDGNVNGSAAPGRSGSVLACYLTGAGVNTNLRISIGGYFAEVVYAGAAPGLLGLTQVNLRIPWGLAAGPQPVYALIGSVSSPAGVSVEIR